MEFFKEKNLKNLKAKVGRTRCYTLPKGDLGFLSGLSPLAFGSNLSLTHKAAGVQLSVGHQADIPGALRAPTRTGAYYYYYYWVISLFYALVQTLPSSGPELKVKAVCLLNRESSSEDVSGA